MDASPNAPDPDASSFTVAQARAIDRYAVEVLGLPSIVLMENAAINAASLVLDLLADAVELDHDRFRVSILCGGGNNGGDGYALARQLLAFGVEVRVFAARRAVDLTGDAAVNADVWRAMDQPVTSCTNKAEAEAARDVWSTSHLLVDAVLGTGFSDRLRPDLAGVLGVVNDLRQTADHPPRVLSLDVPSGLDADAGTADPAAVVADVTLTFVGPKIGFRRPSAAAYLGRVVVAEIGLPPGAIRQARVNAGPAAG
jgi:NAD(P)H-hydrate epimerase